MPKTKKTRVREDLPVNQPEIFRNVMEICHYFGVSRRAVYDWINGPGSPRRNEDGSFNKQEFIEWYAARKDARKLVATTGDEDKGIDEQLSLAKLRKENALASIHEIKAKLLDPEFISTMEANQFLTTFFGELRRNFLSLPVDMCASYPLSYREVVQEDLRARVEMVLNQMADWILEFQKRRGSDIEIHGLDD
jgi:predicted DNA-binding transcriptional regulator AlpA